MTAMMLSSPRERCNMGNLARLHVTESFSLEAMLDRWEKLYLNLLSRSYQPNRAVQDRVAA
jgi:hypothetical protein